MINNEKNKLQNITEDMKRIIDNIESKRVSIEQVKTTLEIMIKECEELLSK